jgi:hypothetical protein
VTRQQLRNLWRHDVWSKMYEMRDYRGTIIPRSIRRDMLKGAFRKVWRERPKANP